MQIVKINWDLEDANSETAASLGLPTEIEVPDEIDYRECSDFLSDEYGWCIDSLTLIDTY